MIKAFILNDMRKYLYNRIWLSLFFVMFCRTTEVSKISKNNISKRKHLVYMNCNSVFKKYIFISLIKFYIAHILTALIDNSSLPF